jgi:hypothetical protein
MIIFTNPAPNSHVLKSGVAITIVSHLFTVLLQATRFAQETAVEGLNEGLQDCLPKLS